MTHKCPICKRSWDCRCGDCGYPIERKCPGIDDFCVKPPLHPILCAIGGFLLWAVCAAILIWLYGVTG